MSTVLVKNMLFPKPQTIADLDKGNSDSENNIISQTLFLASSYYYCTFSTILMYCII